MLKFYQETDPCDIGGILTAMESGRRSKCKKFKIGAAIYRDGTLIRASYNGTFPGEDNTCEHPCESCSGNGFITSLQEACDVCGGTGLSSKDSNLHAERNGIAWCKEHGIDLTGTVMYVTMAPCLECAKDIVDAGICKVAWAYDYKDIEGVEYLLNNHVTLLSLDFPEDILGNEPQLGEWMQC